MAATSFDHLDNVRASSKAVFRQENKNLPEIEIQRLRQLRVDGTSERHGPIRPSKRSMPRTLSGNRHPSSKRQEPVGPPYPRPPALGLPDFQSPSSHSLERQISMDRTYTQSSISRPVPIMKRRMSGTVVPTPQRASQLRRGNTETIRPLQNPVTHTITRPLPQPIYPFNEVQDFSPADYLPQSPNLTSTPCVSATLSPTLERDELQMQDFSYLSISSRSDFTWPMSYSPYPPTSDTDLTIARTSSISTSLGQCRTHRIVLRAMRT